MNVFEESVLNALEKCIEDGKVSPLSEEFFNRIEALKQRAEELNADNDWT
jgi:hypothetical protein